MGGLAGCLSLSAPFFIFLSSAVCQVATVASWELMEALSLSRFVLWEGATSLRTNQKRPPDASESTIDGVTNVYSVRVVAMPTGPPGGKKKKKKKRRTAAV